MLRHTYPSISRSIFCAYEPSIFCAYEQCTSKKSRMKHLRRPNFDHPVVGLTDILMLSSDIINHKTIVWFSFYVYISNINVCVLLSEEWNHKNCQPSCQLPVVNTSPMPVKILYFCVIFVFFLSFSSFSCVCVRVSQCTV